MHVETSKFCKEGNQTKTNNQKKLTDVFVCVSPNLNHCRSQECSHMGCNAKALDEVHTAAPKHGLCNQEGIVPGVEGTSSTEWLVWPLTVKDPWLYTDIQHSRLIFKEAHQCMIYILKHRQGKVQRCHQVHPAWDVLGCALASTCGWCTKGQTNARDAWDDTVWPSHPQRPSHGVASGMSARLPP